MLDKPQVTKDMRSFQREMVRHELLHLEVRIADRERELEARGGERGFFRMYEECGNIQQRLIKPKNIFQFQHVIGSNVRTLVVNASIASIANSEVFEIDNQIVQTRNDTVYRAGKVMQFEFIVRDRFGNLRGDGYEDVVEMNVTRNHVNESMMSMFEQDSSTGHYLNTYEFTGVGTYRVYFYLNGFPMPYNFTFQVINDILSPLYTETKFLGY